MVYRRNIFIIGVAVATMIVVDIFSYRSTQDFIKAARDRQSHHQTFVQLESILSTMKDAQTNQRGYIITGEGRFLESDNKAKTVIDQKLEEVRKLTELREADENKQDRRKKIDALELLIREELAELSKAIELRKQKGFSAASQMILAGKGQEVMDDIKKAVEKMKLEEEKLIARRDRQVESNFRTTLLMFFSGNAVGFSLIGLVFLALAREIAERKRVEEGREKLVSDLQNALAQVKTLKSGLLSICAQCKKIRDDKGYWIQLETYIRQHTDTQFSHGICPECLKKYYPEFKK